MKRYNIISSLFIFTLFCSGSCENRIEQRFIIQNNSEQEIVVIYSTFTINSPVCLKGNDTKQEYVDFIYHNAIKPNSDKNITGLGGLMIANLQDTTYIYVFNRLDMDTMSCDEFKLKYPLKKEWKVTVADMEEDNWTLVYP